MTRRASSSWFGRQPALIGLLTAAILSGSFAGARADQVQLQNGDQLAGKVVSMDANTLVLQSQVLGVLRVPRNQIALVNFGAQARTNPAPVLAPAQPLLRAPSPAHTNAAPSLDVSLRQLGSQTNLIRQVRDQFLAGAG